MADRMRRDARQHEWHRVGFLRSGREVALRLVEQAIETTAKARVLELALTAREEDRLVIARAPVVQFGPQRPAAIARERCNGEAVHGSRPSTRWVFSACARPCCVPGRQRRYRFSDCAPDADRQP